MSFAEFNFCSSFSMAMLVCTVFKKLLFTASSYEGGTISFQATRTDFQIRSNVSAPVAHGKRS